MNLSELPIALDAMGGDHAPGEIVRGALEAVHSDHLHICLVGNRERIQAELRAFGEPQPPEITLHDAPDVISMREHPARALRAKPQASLPVCVDLVQAGKACAAVSAGNSGAILAAGMLILKRQTGIDRPAFAGTLPVPNGQVLLIDLGANAECKPEYLLQFARMGAIYMRLAYGVDEPRIGLISNGEEEEKGTALTLAAFDLLRASTLNFAGNVEGNDILSGNVDVVVCDGFTGNVILKTLEGAAGMITGLLRDQLRSSMRTRLGAALAMPALRALGKRLDYAEYGGVPVLGVNGVLINCHGRSRARAVAQALRLANRMVRQGLTEAIGHELGKTGPMSVSR